MILKITCFHPVPHLAEGKPGQATQSVNRAFPVLADKMPESVPVTVG